MEPSWPVSFAAGAERLICDCFCSLSPAPADQCMILSLLSSVTGCDPTAQPYAGQSQAQVIFWSFDFAEPPPGNIRKTRVKFAESPLSILGGCFCFDWAGSRFASPLWDLMDLRGPLVPDLSPVNWIDANLCIYGQITWLFHKPGYLAGSELTLPKQESNVDGEKLLQLLREKRDTASLLWLFKGDASSTTLVTLRDSYLKLFLFLNKENFLCLCSVFQWAREAEGVLYTGIDFFVRQYCPMFPDSFG